MGLKGLKDWGYPQNEISCSAQDLSGENPRRSGRTRQFAVFGGSVALCAFTLAGLGFLSIGLDTTSVAGTGVLSEALKDVTSGEASQTIWQCGEGVYSSTQIPGMNCFEHLGPNAPGKPYRFIQYSKIGGADTASE